MVARRSRAKGGASRLIQCGLMKDRGLCTAVHHANASMPHDDSSAGLNAESALVTSTPFHSRLRMHDHTHTPFQNHRSLGTAKTRVGLRNSVPRYSQRHAVVLHALAACTHLGPFRWSTFTQITHSKQFDDYCTAKQGTRAKLDSSIPAHTFQRRTRPTAL